MNRRDLLEAALLAGPVLALSRASAQTKKPAALKMGVIGAGSLGGTVGGLWVAAGHQVLFSSRHPEELAPMVKRLGGRATAGAAAEAAAFGDVVLFAVPYDALQNEYSIWTRDPEVEVLATCEALGIGLVAWGLSARVT